MSLQTAIIIDLFSFTIVGEGDVVVDVLVLVLVGCSSCFLFRCSCRCNTRYCYCSRVCGINSPYIEIPYLIRMSCITISHTDNG